jgi:hypothetical protein
VPADRRRDRRAPGGLRQQPCIRRCTYRRELGRRTGDNGGRPFAILDKRGARLFVFEPGARLVGTSLVLLGSAQGDESTPASATSRCR